ncbi:MULTISPECIES: HlyD family type I secretion periplasmic adaptor subunit [Bradyrhizobium]|uniref:HlyD family type I secretion periplasmic adaptor subunit n=1 Tax=Bradyrhizobium TaxID=374 RepID=UPI001BAD9638|nr:MULTISPECIES: HlyD family type I secretion periplasmic adaptor subunit [Bradyrhizobium]MBR0711923.1 HlyD family type I secretion periplasmic adaptor subunit [Bradyrhizobium liaoningense]MDA9398149.1 hemolysin secretion protein D [Bradyrhizobium sp. CCBAU 45389]
MTREPINVVPRSIRRHLCAGLVGVIVLAGGVGGWAATTELAGAVIGSGTLVVDSYTKKVQHPTGGVVGELNVREGARVKAGDVVVRLDETVTRANLLIVVKSLDEQTARRARLEAERDGQDWLGFPVDLVGRAADPDVARLIVGERKLFELRRAARAGKKAQLNERIGQLGEQIRGLDEQIQAKDRETTFIDQELLGVRDLWRKNLVQITRLTTLERDAVRLHGERGALVAAIAEARGRITETTLQIMQIDQDLRTEVGKDLAEIRAKTSELVEKRVAAEDQLKRIDIRAPQDGTVHQLALHTVGGVISPGEQIMLIVPAHDALVVEVRIPPHEIDRLSVGQPVLLRFSAFNQRTTPQLNGEVSHVSADVAVDQKSTTSFYVARIAVPEAELARLGDLKLIAGMPVEAFIQTGQRTVMSYLVKPFSDQLMRAWRER